MWLITTSSNQSCKLYFSCSLLIWFRMYKHKPTHSLSSYRPIPSTCQSSTEEWQRRDNVLENTRTYRHQRGAESCQSCEHQPVCLAGWVLPSWTNAPIITWAVRKRCQLCPSNWVQDIMFYLRKNSQRKTSVVIFIDNNELCIHKWLECFTNEPFILC